MFKMSFNDIKDLCKVILYFSLLLGFVIFSVYFFQIGYFPIVDLQSILYLPIIVALVGFLIFCCFVGPLGLAPYMWLELLKTKNTCELIMGKKNAEFVMKAYKDGPIDLGDSCRIRISLAYILSMFISLGSWLFVALINDYFQYGIATFLLLGILGKNWLYLSNENGVISFPYSSKNRTSFIRTLLKIYSFSIFPGLCLLFFAYSLSKILIIHDNFLAFVFLISIIVSSSMCLTPYSIEWKLYRWIIFVTSITIFLFLILLGGTSNLVTKIIHLFKFGAITNATLNIGKIGCEIFNLNGFDLPCNTNQKVYVISDIDILWRVGEYYIQDPKHQARRFIFPLKYIYAVSIPDIKGSA